MILDVETVCSLIDVELAEFIHNIIVIIKVAVPIILVVFGMLDFAKGVMSSKEDEIKKGQQVFIKRLIAAVIVFFIITVVQLVIGVVSDGNSEIWDCANSIMNGTVGEDKDDSSKEDGSNPYYSGQYIDVTNYSVTLKEDNTIKIINYTGSATDVTIPDTIELDGTEYKVTELESYAFYNKNLVNVTISENITTIGAYAFADNENLKTITFPKNVVTIGHAALGCYEGYSITKINNDAGKTFDWADIIDIRNEKCEFVAGKCGSVQIWSNGVTAE